LLATNDYAGKSVGQLNDLATSIGNVSGSFGDAHDIVQALASTGKVAGDQFATVAQGVSDFAQVTGSSIQDAVETFTKLGDDPVKAATSLNDQYHYLTASVYEQIEAAQKQGDTEKAASIAQDALAESFSKRRESMVEDMGLLQKGWDELKASASATWDAMLGIGRQKSIAD
jgi:phage-related minor tail protein